MAWSWEVGRPAKVAVRVHATFLVLLVWAAFNGWKAQGDITGAFVAIAWVLVMFGLVVLHELGHALMARLYGCETKDIILLPIGGVARLEKMPERPREELAVALAGPAVNLVLALFFGLLTLAFGLPLVGELDAISALAMLAWVNLSLAVFNLLPAFPMDGGRALRAILAMRRGRVEATKIAASLGQALAIGLGMLGLLANPVLILIAVFIWMGAAAERAQTEMEDKLSGVETRRGMMTEFDTLTPDSRVGEAVERILAGFQTDFPVVRGRGEAAQVVGILERNAVVRALAKEGSQAPIRDYWREDVIVAQASDPLVKAIELLAQKQRDTLVVLDEGRLVGLLSREQAAEFVLLQGAALDFRSSQLASVQAA